MKRREEVFFMSMARITRAILVTVDLIVQDASRKDKLFSSESIIIVIILLLLMMLIIIIMIIIIIIIIIIKAQPNGCNIIQHCWTMLHSVEWHGQPNATCCMQHLDSRIWHQIYQESLGNKFLPFFGLPRKSGETSKFSASTSDHLLAFRGLTA